MDTSLLEKILTYLKQGLINYGGYISLVLYLYLAYTIFSNNPYNVITSYNALSILVALIIGFIVITTSNFAQARGNLFGEDSANPSLKNWLAKSGGSLSILLIVGFVLYGFFWILTNFGRFLSLLPNVAFYFSLVIGLGIIYKFIQPKLEKLREPTVIQLIKSIIFYIPCLLIDFIDNIAGTKKSVWFLLIIELCIIALYFIIPKILESKYLQLGQVLSKEPQYLNNIVSMNNEKLNEILESSKDKLHYALSADIWITPQPTSTNVSYTKDTNLLSFGDRLHIEYNGKTSPQHLIIKALDGQETIEVARPKILLQKWNTVVLNYDHGILDIFINGELIHSQPNVPYMTAASVHAGSRNGIHGGIKDIRFFNKPLSKNELSIINVV